jgi:hypothetical protein
MRCFIAPGDNLERDSEDENSLLKTKEMILLSWYRS